MAEIKPQAGPQEAFLATSADIAIYGGAAGGGKTWGLEFEPLRHIGKPGFNAVIFRRNAIQVLSPGGLWDESLKLYPGLGGQPKEYKMEWTFPGGARVKFAHLDREVSVLDWQGSQIAFIAFDELTHFTRGQFFYMLSRNRSLCGIKPYVRATCNPDSDSWVAEFISWWIDQETGLAIPERSGKIRWMVSLNDKVIWADTAEELVKTYGQECQPKSVTFISSSLYDNKILMEADPGYLANLKALPRIDRERLLGGNWKIRPAAGLYFQRSWCQVVDAAPADLQTIRYWDLAATKKTEANNPDFTVGIKMGKAADGRFYVLHCESMREGPHHVRQAIRNLAEQDGKTVTVGLPQDPGQAGKSQVQDLALMLNGWPVKSRPEGGDKPTRFGPFSAQCEAGNVFFLRAAWNNELFNALEAFPEATHDDHADACSGAYNLLIEKRPPLSINPAILRRQPGAWTRGVRL